MRLALSPADFLEEVNGFCASHLPGSVAPLLKRAVSRIMASPAQHVVMKNMVVPMKRKLLMGAMVLADDCGGVATSSTVSPCSTVCTLSTAGSSGAFVTLTKSILAFSAKDIALADKRPRGPGIKDRSAIVKEKVVLKGLALLTRLGCVSERYIELNLYNGEAYKNFEGIVIELMFGKLSVECVSGYIREVD